tara:strand:- start:39 stop:521 length:483 start_codon:yes stop_codon:yes gene_type:complete
MKKYRLLFVLGFVVFIFGEGNKAISDFQISSERYLTDEKGNVTMFINVWGHVPNPGHIQVYEGIDLASLLSLVGGPIDGADLKNIKLIREIADSEQVVHNINFENFIKRGDRSGFVKIKPNDTIIISQTKFNYVIGKIGSINTLLSLFNMYFIINNNYGN